MVSKCLEGVSRKESHTSRRKASAANLKIVDDHLVMVVGYAMMKVRRVQTRRQLM